MGVEGMLVAFQGNNATAETVSLMFPEGTTVPEIVQKLADKKFAIRLLCFRLFNQLIFRILLYQI